MDIFYIRREQQLDVAIMMDDNNNSWDNVHNEKSLSDNDVLLLNEHPIWKYTREEINKVVRCRFHSRNNNVVVETTRLTHFFSIFTSSIWCVVEKNVEEEMKIKR
jgi:hypothetical protein